MSERRPGDHVADRPDAVERGAQRAVDLDQSRLLALDRRLLQSETLDVRGAAGRDAEVVEFLGFAVEADLDALVRRFRGIDFGPGLDAHVLLADLPRGGL